ncbi:MAG: hypothetical protein ACFFA0_04225 [Promethearchaeota archaeon]
MKRSNEREKKKYEELASCLKDGNLNHLKNLLDNFVDYNIFIDVNKIPRRFESISKLLLDCVEKVTAGEISALGEQINILKFCNEFGLLEKELNKDEKITVNKIKEDRLFLANLNDLFGKVSDSFISYIRLEYSQEIYKYFIRRFTEDPETMMYYIKNFFNYFSIYGLVVRNLGSINNFISKFKQEYESFQNQKYKEDSKLTEINEKFIEFNLQHRAFSFGDDEEHEYRDIKRHFVSSNNILKNLDNILMENNYNFYSLSMVLLWGLGPQGLGFTYSTPKREVIEICSDQKETEAIIIEFRQFQKKKFIEKLEKKLINLDIRFDIKEDIINYLSEILDPKKLINFHNKDTILRDIKKYLEQFDGFQFQVSFDLNNLFMEISEIVSIILRKIKLKDQFITRMDLVAEDKMKSEEIAKLTSLKGKSHYDVLKERFFYQYIVDWLYEIYLHEKRKMKKEN